MSLPDNDFVAGLVLAAGGSSRLGRPKQTLPYDGTTLLGHVLDSARACGFDQLLVTLGGAADEVREKVDLRGADVVENRDYGDGCSSSIAAACGSTSARTRPAACSDARYCPSPATPRCGPRSFSVM